MTTPKAITFIVVGGLCTMALTYMITLSACVLFGIEPPEKLMGSFKDAGMFVLGAFTGILVNTRSQQNEPSTLEVHASRTNSNANVHPESDAKPAADSVTQPNSDAKPEPNSITVSASSTSTTESS